MMPRGGGTGSRWNTSKRLPLPGTYILGPRSPPKGVSAERAMIH